LTVADRMRCRHSTKAADAGPEHLAAFANSLYDKTEAELGLLVDARRPPGRPRSPVTRP